ncbi:hypothetical protein DITRI_Ditri19aG0197400 [Diplodiscus trichospermus]
MGRSLSMDQITANQQRLAFAKVCVQVEANAVIPSSIEVKMNNGSMVTVKVITPWLPQRCSSCNIFGHSNKNCNKKVVQAEKVWIPKKPIIEIGKPVGIFVANNEKQGLEESTNETRLVEKKDLVTDGDSIDINLVVCKFATKKAGSVNRFSILEYAMFDGLGEIVEKDMKMDDMKLEEQLPRQTKAASAGVVELMKTLKP